MDDLLEGRRRSPRRDPSPRPRPVRDGATGEIDLRDRRPPASAEAPSRVARQATPAAADELANEAGDSAVDELANEATDGAVDEAACEWIHDDANRVVNEAGHDGVAEAVRGWVDEATRGWIHDDADRAANEAGHDAVADAAPTGAPNAAPTGQLGVEAGAGPAPARPAVVRSRRRRSGAHFRVEPPPATDRTAGRRRYRRPGGEAGTDDGPAAGPTTVPPPDPAAPGDGAEPRGRLGIDPRFRQRRIDVKREEGRRRLRWLITGTAALSAVAVGVGIVWSPIFAVRHARVLGAAHTPVAAVLAAAGLDHHPLMVDVDAARAAAAIDRLPWVARAQVRRHWPDAVTVSVAERVPVAVIGPVGDIALVDASGRVLAQAPLGAPLPEVELEAAPGTSGSVGGPAPGLPGSDVAPGYLPGLAAAATMPPALVPRILAIVVGTDGTLTLRLSGGASAVLGDSTQLAQKLIAVLTLVERVRIGTKTIDATVPALPVLRSGP